jgi:hypothetical protein
MTIVTRGMFVGLLILGLTAQVARTLNSVTTAAATSDLAAGLARLGGRVLVTMPSGAATAVVSGCADPVIVGQVGFDGSGDGLLDGTAVMDVVPRYAYLGFVGDRLDLTAIGGRWVAASTRQVFGLRRDRAPEKVVVVLVPKTCPSLTGFDWSVLSPWS